MGAQTEVQLEDLVVVTEDLAMDSAGCDAISVFNIVDGSRIQSSDTLVSPGRLAVRDDASVMISTLSNSCAVSFREPNPPDCTPALIALTAVDGSRGGFSTGRIRGNKFGTMGGIAFLRDSTLLVAEAGYDLNDGASILVPRSPYFVARITLPAAIANRDALALQLGRMAIASLPIEFLRTADSRFTAIVQSNGSVGVIDTSTMKWAEPPIPYPTAVSGYSRPYGGKAAIGAMHATIMADGRRIIVNRMLSPSIAMIDVATRKSVVVPL